MDILTEKGQKTLQDERKAINLFIEILPEYGFIETPKNKPSDFDIIITKNNETFAIAETKCRYDCDYNKFKDIYKFQWLITFEKLIKLKSISDSMKVDAIGFLYIVKSNILLVKTIIHDGAFCVNFEVKNSYTQKSVNGGNILRTNAYVDMSKARILYGSY